MQVRPFTDQDGSERTIFVHESANAVTLRRSTSAFRPVAWAVATPTLFCVNETVSYWATKPVAREGRWCLWTWLWRRSFNNKKDYRKALASLLPLIAAADTVDPERPNVFIHLEDSFIDVEWVSMWSRARKSRRAAIETLLHGLAAVDLRSADGVNS